MTVTKKWILINAGIIILFCGSFVFFYGFFHARAKDRETTLSPALLNRPLPRCHLVDLSGGELSSAALGDGKVMLVLATAECDYCLEEGAFLGTVVGLREDVHFYGVVPFGADKSVLKAAGDKFPFKLFFDEGGLLRDALNVNQVPTKIYLEGGIVKRTWVGTTAFNHKEDEFKQWLESLR